MHSIIKNGGEAVVTVFAEGWAEPRVAKSSHPNYDAIVEALTNAERFGYDPDYIEIEELFDVPKAVAAKFEKVSNRVSVRDKRVYFDGDEVNGTITHQIVRVLSEGNDAAGLALFLEKVAANPSDHSREQLYDWLDAHEFTITDGGYIIGYKGVSPDGLSLQSGHAIVNGEEVNGRVDNSLGNTIEMPRSEVADDPDTACSTGLHVATRNYAEGWGQRVLEVLVSPTDVVSVPRDGQGEKVRVCRYYVLNVSDSPHTEAQYAVDEVPSDW